MRLLAVVLVIGMVVASGGCSKDEDGVVQPAAPKTGSLEGRVYWGNWNSIPGARVCISNGGCDYTDSRAWYRLDDIKEGTPVITVTADGYRHFQGPVRIHANSDNQYSVQLEPIGN